MIEPMVLEFKIDDRFIDHPLLSKKELLKYDIDYCYKKVEEEVDKFISAQINYPFINAPTITCNYSLVKMNLHFFLNVYIISIPVTNLLEKQILQDFY